MNNKYTFKSILNYGAALFLMMSIASCVDKFLPSDLDSLGPDSRFTQLEYTPVLGRNTLMNNNFNAGNASQPLTFKIINMRRSNGDAAPELLQNFPVEVWTKPYLGNEKSIEEINEKRTIEHRPLFDIRKHNGAFEMWAGTNSAFIRTAPDAAYLFDVEVTNSGGRRYFKDMRLVPFKERAFEPSNLDPVTGNALHTSITPTRVSGIRGERSSEYLASFFIEVDIHKMVDDEGKDLGNGNSLTILFRDSLNNSINPDKFSLTKWDELLHGFNMEKTTDYVKYDVAYPIPLIDYKTKYTTLDGTRASLNFGYDRLGFGGNREESWLGLDFSIYEKGDWRIIFRFTTESPKFVND